MILDMQSIYTTYLDQANKVDKEPNKIHTCTLRLKQGLHISNKEREQIVFLVQ